MSLWPRSASRFAFSYAD